MLNDQRIKGTTSEPNIISQFYRLPLTDIIPQLPEQIQIQSKFRRTQTKERTHIEQDKGILSEIVSNFELFSTGNSRRFFYCCTKNLLIDIKMKDCVNGKNLLENGNNLILNGKQSNGISNGYR